MKTGERAGVYPGSSLVNPSTRKIGVSIAAWLARRVPGPGGAPGPAGWSYRTRARARRQARAASSRSRSVWASETKAASNWEAARNTPCSSMAWKKRA